jgi:hypothetical protein
MRYDEFNKWTQIEMVASCSMIKFAFLYKNEKRILHLHFGCDHDGDQEGLLGPKIIFSLGMWGENEVLMRAVCEALRPLGPVYLQLNDCSDDPLELLPPAEEDQEDDQTIL